MSNSNKKDYAEEHARAFAKKLDEVEALKKGCTAGSEQETLGKIINTVLLPFEKQCRVSDDLATTSKVALLVLTLCYADFKDFDTLVGSLEILVKRRGQLQGVVKEVVTKALEFCGVIDQNAVLRSLDFDRPFPPTVFDRSKAVTWLTEAQTLSLLKKLLELTEGKIYVERERTVAICCLARMQEEAGNAGEACRAIQDIQIETFTHLTGEEKTIFIINQVRLLVQAKDYSKALVVANKVAKRVLNKKKNVLIKIKFCRLMVDYWSLVRNWLKVASFYDELYQTYLAIQTAVDKGEIDSADVAAAATAMDVEQTIPKNDVVKNSGNGYVNSEEEEEEEEKKRQEKIDNTYPLSKAQADAMRGETMECLEQLILHTVLSPYSCEQNALLGKTLKERSVEDTKDWKELAELFFRSEIISWSRNVVKRLKQLLCRKSPLFASESFEDGIAFKGDNVAVEPNVWHDLRCRVTEHNLNVVAAFYTRITMQRLQAILEVSSVDEAEKAVRDQVTSPYLDEHIYAKIDRPAGIVRFAKPQDASVLLDTWSAQLGELVGLVDETCHLIQREYTK